MKKVALISLGCAKNLVDSEMMLAMFDQGHFMLTDKAVEADLVIVNTCAFIESAKRESLDVIFKIARENPKAKVAVVGCLATRYLKELPALLPEASTIVPVERYQELHEVFASLLEEKEGIDPISPLRRVISTPSFSAYLRISEGCDHFCSFCAIPYIRGRFKSRPYAEVLEEARILRDRGVKEISIVSQDTASFGKDFPDGKPNINDLLRALDGIGFYSIRLLYLYPEEIDEEFLDIVAGSNSIKHYFDVPVQCASDHLLRLMNRKGTKESMTALFARIREKCPDAVLRTTLISGFPGETEEDQKETIEWLKDIEFDHLGVFAYSKEEGTAGSKMPHQVPKKLKESRRDEIMQLQRHISYKRNKARVGACMEGIVIGMSPDGKDYLLRSSWNAPDEIDGNIFFSSPRCLRVGEIVKVRITSAFVYDLRGVLEE